MKQILYIEDHEDTRELVCLVLRRAGVTVHAVASLQAAREAVSARKYNLYLLDCLVPDGSGIDFCQEIRQGDLTTPIVIHSAKSYESDKEAATRAGASDYLVKPVE